MASIGKAARDSGVPVETIRYYERAGVVPGPPRSASGRRVYDSGHIARLRLIRHCRDLGFSLADARTLLALAGNHTAPCAEVKSIAEGHLAGVRRKIRDLQRLEGALADLVRDCDEGKADCPALRVLSE
jgi:MerR family mercuric resistance operon transcriptional regulator